MPNSAGKQDNQSVLQGGRRAVPPKIAGVQILELGNVLTRSGWMTELFRKDWDGVKIVPQQINWVELSPNGVTDWHRHAGQTDHLIGVGGVLKLALWDQRAASPTHQETDVIRMGALRPVMVIVRPACGTRCATRAGNRPDISTSSINSTTTNAPTTGGFRPGCLRFRTSCNHYR